MSTYSPDLRIELIANGAQPGTWGTTTNDTLAYVIDPAISGFQTVAVASADQALTYVSGSTATASANQAIYASLAFTTGLGTAFNIYAPPNAKQYVIWNNSSQAMTLYNSSVIGNTTPAGTGVTIPAGRKYYVFSNGTNFYALESTPSGFTGIAYSDGTNFSAASGAQMVAAIGSTAVTNATNATKLATTNFSVEESGGNLVFKYGATTIASMTSAGVLTTLGDVVAGGTP
jgi:hypothetical protein